MGKEEAVRQALASAINKTELTSLLTFAFINYSNWHYTLDAWMRLWSVARQFESHNEHARFPFFVHRRRIYYHHEWLWRSSWLFLVLLLVIFGVVIDTETTHRPRNRGVAPPLCGCDNLREFETPPSVLIPKKLFAQVYRLVLSVDCLIFGALQECVTHWKID